MATLLSIINNTSTTEIYTLSLHDALPISQLRSNTIELGVFTLPVQSPDLKVIPFCREEIVVVTSKNHHFRSEEHTSELQSRFDLVCRLLLEKKKLKTGDELRRPLPHHDDS